MYYNYNNSLYIQLIENFIDKLNERIEKVTGFDIKFKSEAFDEFKNMMLPEEDVYKPKNKKKSLKKKGITLGLEIFMGGNDKE